jgi:hypothetical protein
MTLGQYGRVVTIARKDRGVTWTLYIDKNQYSERALDTSKQAGQFDPSNFDLANMKKEILGRETVLGYPCTKMRVQVGNMPNGQPLTSTVWVADGIEIGVRMEAMGMVQENRNFRIGPQPASLFEIPAGYTRTTGFGGPSMGQGGQVGGGGMPRPPYGGKTAPSTGGFPPPAAPAPIPAAGAWKENTDRTGADYKTLEFATSNPAPCKAACDREAQCKAWTFVKPDEPGGMGVCWLKEDVPGESYNPSCISGVKGAGTAGGSGGGSAWQENTDRGGSDYRSLEMTTTNPGACKALCDVEAQCKAWTFVKPDTPGGKAGCWLKEDVPPESYDPRCVSGVKVR